MNNPPAFPMIAETHEHIIGTGMSLRDYFAAKAVVGYLAHDGDGFDTIQEAANFCYKWADAMLKARQQ